MVNRASHTHGLLCVRKAYLRAPDQDEYCVAFWRRSLPPMYREIAGFTSANMSISIKNTRLSDYYYLDCHSGAKTVGNMQTYKLAGTDLRRIRDTALYFG